MKTVFSSNSETIHVWAQREQTYGRSKSGNVFFEDGTLYSYGYHFPLGWFIETEDGFVGAVINMDFYSRSTSEHQSIAWGATTHYTQFNKKYTEEKSVISLLNELEEKLLKARKPLLYIREAEHTIAQHKAYLEFIDGRAELSDDVLSAYAPFQLDSDELKALQDKDKERRKKETQRQREKLELKIKDFLNYKTSQIGNYKTNEAYVRISKDGEKIETSKGVKVPVREAKILYNKILKGEDIRGYRIDHYTVTGLNGTLKIGCHDINLKNMHEVGKQLLSSDMAPEKTA